MPVVVLQLLEQVTWLSYWELAASAGAVIVVVVRPDGCDDHEWPEKLGGVALHCIGFVTQGQGVAVAGAFVCSLRQALQSHDSGSVVAASPRAGTTLTLLALVPRIYMVIHEQKKNQNLTGSSQD